MQERKFKSLTFPDKIAREAKCFRQQAETKPHGTEREALLNKARQADTAAKIDKWISSPGLRSPR